MMAKLDMLKVCFMRSASVAWSDPQSVGGTMGKSQRLARSELIFSPFCLHRGPVDISSSVLVCSDHAIVGENNISAVEFRPIRSLELLYSR